MNAAILTYHSLDDQGSVTSVAPQIFTRQMESLHAAGVEVLPLERLIDATRRESAHHVVPRVAITFDDGFGNLIEHAVPVLHRLGYPATVFVVADRCGKDNAWSTQPASIARHRLLDTSELKRMVDAGWQIGSHSRNHALLTEIGDEELEAELLGSRQRLEQDIGVAVPTFAYPYGILDQRVRAAAERWFDLACGTRFDYLDTRDDRHDLPRLDMYYFRNIPDISHLFNLTGRTYVAMRAVLRKVRQGIVGARP